MSSFPRALFTAALALVAVAAGAQQSILETEPGVDALGFCDWVHDIQSCQRSHIEAQEPLAVGGPLQLDGRAYVVDWMGPGYYLSNGVVLQAAGAATGLAGQRWTEVYPRRGAAHVSHGWKDKDGNRVLSPSDTLDLDAGGEVEVRDVRLQLRVSPAPSGKAEARPE